MNERIISYQIGKDKKPGVTPSIVLCDPKFAHNVSMTVRLASNYGFKQVWFTGERVGLDIEQKKRMPREERMKGYQEVDIINYDRPLEVFPNDAVPVAVEVRENAELLHNFIHPPNAVYVFGPEDGSIAKPILHACHRFLVIPTHHCLNLATAVSAIMWDRRLKEYLYHGRDMTDFTTPGEFENRGYEGRGYADFEDKVLVESAYQSKS